MEKTTSRESKDTISGMAADKSETKNRINESMEINKSTEGDRRIHKDVIQSPINSRQDIEYRDPKEFIYQRAIETWGIDLQAVCAVEEMAELTQAITKEIRKGNLANREPNENLYEEIADVEIMLEQFVWWIRNGRKRVNNHKMIKLQRLEKVLDKLGGKQ